MQRQRTAAAVAPPPGVACSPALGYARGIDAEVAAAVAEAVRQLQALRAHVEQLDTGIDDPLPITIGL